jgi:hypothetical protein
MQHNKKCLFNSLLRKEQKTKQNRRGQGNTNKLKLYDQIANVLHPDTSQLKQNKKPETQHPTSF